MGATLGPRIRYGFGKFLNGFLSRSARVIYSILGNKIFLAPLYRFNDLSKQNKNILILCQGNICRSPYAEQRLKALHAKSDKHTSLHIFSRGALTTPGKHADPSAIRFAKERGIDLTPHRTAALKLNDVESADLILIMDGSHRRALKRLDPTAISKTIFLGTFLLPESKEFIIDDPFGSDAPGQKERFTECYTRIDLALTNLVKALR